jgi:hypothetical protein
MLKNVNTQISIIGGSYFQPIADLIVGLISHSRPHRNAVQVGSHENGYSVSINLLLIALLESYLVRLRFFYQSKIPSIKNNRSAVEVLLTAYPRLRYPKALKDIFVLRDSIFHNHLWEIDYFWRNNPDMVLIQANKDPAFGDKKWNLRVNSRTRRTKALKLHVVPTRVDRSDAFKVFDVVWRTLLFLEKNDRLLCYVSHLTVQFQNEEIRFEELREKLLTSL